MKPLGDERALLQSVQRQVEILLRHELTSASDRTLTQRWSSAATRGFHKLVDADGRLVAENLRNFRRDEILIPDLPAAPLRSDGLASRLIAWRRGSVHCLTQCLGILVERGFDGLLRRYPCPRAGNPHVFSLRGCEYTFSWARHVYSLGLMNRVLGGRLGDGTSVLELGGCYGAFGNLVRQDHPSWRYVCVDLPEHLIAAHYFLGSCFPQARIAGPAELIDLPLITRDVVERFDCLLLPPSLFARLAPGTIDVLVSFGSLGEMSQQGFDAYVHSDLYRSAQYQLMINRVAARPEVYDNEITVLDYPVWDKARRLHFDVCPMYAVDFLFKSGTFFYERGVPDPHFEYVGRLSA